jgi:glutaredoxin
MTADQPLIVFSRKDCHLCELAVSMLVRTGIGWRLVDIDADPELESRYGIHVPVLSHPGSGRELFFPFNEEQIVSFAKGEQ